MSYINENFNDLEDLHQLDERIEELQSLTANVKSVAEFKVHDTKQVSLVEYEDNPKVKESTKDITDKLSEMERVNINQCIPIVGGLIQTYGNVEVIATIKSQLETKVQISKNVKYLERAKVVEDELNEESLDYKKVAHSVKALKQTPNPLAGETMEIIESLLDKRVGETRQILEKSLTELLNKNNWLVSKKTTISQDTMKPIRENISKLVDLQCINHLPEYPDTWWVLDILLKPVFARFDYHFNSNRSTDKISRPELALGFIDNFLQDNLPVLNMIMADIFKEKNRILEFEVITSLLNPVRAKFLKIVKIINDNIKANSEDPSNLEKSGQLLAHLIKELADFDQNLRNKYKYNPYIVKFDQVPSKVWAGVTDDIFSHDEENIANWLTLEKRLALKQLQGQILGSPDKYTIDNDYQGAQINQEQDLKPTMSALNLTKLINNLTSHFQTLTSPSSQLKFVKSIQLTLLDDYLVDLLLTFKSFNDKFLQKSMFSFIPGNKKPSSDLSENNLANGMKALDVLLGLYCSAQFVSQSLEQWSNELCFVQISQSQGYDIFESCTKKYADLNKNISKKFEDFYRKEIQFTLKNYVNSSVWDSDTPVSDAVASSDLNLLVRTIPVYLQEIKKSISTLQYVYMSDKTVSIIFNVLNDYVVHNNQFTNTGLDQLKVDINFVTNQLHSTLYLNTTGDFSNDSNKELLKLKQSIEVLDTVDSFDARDFVIGEKPLQELRDRFDDNLDQLTGHDLLGLLPRIL